MKAKVKIEDIREINGKLIESNKNLLKAAAENWSNYGCAKIVTVNGVPAMMV